MPPEQQLELNEPALLGAAGQARAALRQQRVFLVGLPNVGKSSLFNALSDAYVVVSNYPGTTVGVTRGHLHLSDAEGTPFTVPIFDPPGMYGLVPLTEEERVARDALFAEDPGVVVHVLDTKDLERQLALSLRLREAGLPLVLALNMCDEAKARGIEVDAAGLAARLDVPVVTCSAITGEGLAELEAAIHAALRQPAPAPRWLDWPAAVDEARTALAASLAQDRELGTSTMPSRLPTTLAAELALEGDFELAGSGGIDEARLTAARDELEQATGHPPAFGSACFLRARARALIDGLVVKPATAATGFADRLSRLLITPWTGIPLLLVVLYLAFYQFVGVFGAGTVVGWLEEDLFGGVINPAVQSAFEALVPFQPLRDLFVGDYGLLTLGITYAIALVLPIVFFFFLVFSAVEDSGYFPRFALLVDRVFKRIGLNGRAVIPMVLGFGCDTMATVTTRTLETRRERVLATLLLALAIPCSAQLGLIMGMLGSFGFAVWLSYFGILVGVIFAVGWIAARVLPGKAATFHMELPPLRRPRVGHVLAKSFARMRWYFREVLPLFLWASVILWALDQSGGLGLLERGLAPGLSLIGLPVEATESFVIGFFRRDFGAAGLFHLHQQSLEAGGVGVLSPRQVFVGCVTLTLFVPCIAQFMIMWKERGPRAALTTTALVTLCAFVVGATVNQVLLATGWLA
ncbi:MAG: ferrous iron transport protein B [Planctomycetota bacterium]